MTEQLNVDKRVMQLRDVLKEVEAAVGQMRANNGNVPQNLKDLRWTFDQISAKMNQAIYNDQTALIHDSCLQTIAVLIEMLARS